MALPLPDSVALAYSAALTQRIRDEIAASIQSGEWRPGDRVPTEQELAARYGCARATVSKAQAQPA